MKCFACDNELDTYAKCLACYDKIGAERDAALKRERVLVEALESIVANTCCACCQEAALVASAALAAKEE